MAVRTRRWSRLRWTAGAAAAVVVGVVVVGTSWGGRCASVAEGVTGWDGCSTGPQLGVVGVLVLVLDAVFLVHAVTQVRRAPRPGPR